MIKLTALYWLCPNLFETCCSYQIWNEYIFPPKQFCFNSCHVVFALFSIKYISGFEKKQIVYCFYYHFSKCPTFLELCCIKLVFLIAWQLASSFLVLWKRKMNMKRLMFHHLYSRCFLSYLLISLSRSPFEMGLGLPVRRN